MFYPSSELSFSHVFFRIEAYYSLGVLVYFRRRRQVRLAHTGQFLFLCKNGANPRFCFGLPEGQSQSSRGYSCSEQSSLQFLPEDLQHNSVIINSESTVDKAQSI